MSTINLTLEQANTLLAQIGVAAVVVADAEQATPDANIEELAGTVIKGDPAQGFTQEDVDKKIAAAIGRSHGALRSAFSSQFGIKNSELENLEAKEMAAKIREYFDSRYSAKNTELAGQVEELTRQLNAKDEEFTTKFTEQEKSWETKISERDVVDNIVKVFGSIPKRGGDARVQAEMALGKWRSKYDVRFNETTKEVEFFVKGTDEIVMDGKNPVKADKLGKEFFTEIGLDVSDTSHVNPKDVIENNGSGSGNGFQPQGMGVPSGRNVDPKFAALEAELAKGGA